MRVRDDSPTNTRDIGLLTTLYCKICIALDPAMGRYPVYGERGTISGEVLKPLKQPSHITR